MVEQRPSSLVVDIQSLGAFCDMVLLLLIEIRVQVIGALPQEQQARSDVRMSTLKSILNHGLLKDGLICCLFKEVAVAGYFSGKVLSSVTSPVKIEVRIVYAPGRQWRPMSTDGDVRETRCGLGDSRGFPE
jgi:hypothetical protein